MESNYVSWNYHNDIIYFTFNDDASVIACGTENGFMLFKSNIRVYSKDLKGGIGIIQMLEKSNIVALVGGGSRPAFDLNKVVLWDLERDMPVAEFRFGTKVRNVKIKRDK